MKMYTTYSVKIKHYSSIFKETVAIYRHAVNYILNVCLANWEEISSLEGRNRFAYVERLIHTTKDNPVPVYNFDSKFYKMPSYMRRAAINEAIGKVSSYKSNLSNWQKNPVGKEPSYPKAGYVFPSMYRTGMYNQTGDYTVQIKVYIRNTWDWLTLTLPMSEDRGFLLPAKCIS